MKIIRKICKPDKAMQEYLKANDHDCSSKSADLPSESEDQRKDRSPYHHEIIDDCNAGRCQRHHL